MENKSSINKSRLNILKHPLIIHKLTQLRRKETCAKAFREYLNEIAGLMVYEISKDFPLDSVEIETPLSPCSTQELTKEIILVPILRAGLGMVDGITCLIPSARIGHIGLYRNEDTLLPTSYYVKLPVKLSNSVVMLLDPMLATGGSASAAIRVLKDQGANLIKLVCVVGAPEGVKKIEKDHPDVDIYLAALDERLDENGFIVPGLGDAGDRIFGTK